jgi:hypothetical protein
MNTKRTLLINMFDAEHHHPYMYHTNFDFLRKCSDAEIIQHLPSHLDTVDLSQYTDHGAKSYLQFLYVVFQDVRQSLYKAKENDINHFKNMFTEYFKYTDEQDHLLIQQVFVADPEKMLQTARELLNMSEQPCQIVLEKVLENIDEINGCFILDSRAIVDLDLQFLNRIEAVS